MSEPASTQSLSLARGRVYILLAAILWSLSGAFTKLLTHKSPYRLEGEPITAMQIAFFRVLFAGAVLVPTLRPRDISFRWPMLAMLACFVLMNATFVPAMAWGSAANAIYLQYSAPLWMYLASIYLLGEAPDRRSSVSLAIGLMGIGVIIWGGWQEAQLGVIAIALTSGVAYAGIVLFLRILRDASSQWLTVINHLGTAICLLPVLIYLAPTRPTTPQLVVLFLFGAVQLGLPYLLMARGLRVVSAQEAGTITLLEPLLNPLWAYLVAPETEQPRLYSLLGGAFILGALAWRYWPHLENKSEK
jgi:drug/metabolite transporter, DME family